jgi:hypothetical protein
MTRRIVERDQSRFRWRPKWFEGDHHIALPGDERLYPRPSNESRIFEVLFRSTSDGSASEQPRLFAAAAEAEPLTYDGCEVLTNAPNHGSHKRIRLRWVAGFVDGSSIGMTDALCDDYDRPSKTIDDRSEIRKKFLCLEWNLWNIDQVGSAVGL